MAQRTARNARARRMVFWLSLALSALGFAYVLQLGAAATKSSCQQEGPSPDPRHNTDITGNVVESITLWPIGRICEWELRGGAAPVTAHPENFGGSATAYGLILAGTTGALLTRRNARSSMPR